MLKKYIEIYKIKKQKNLKLNGNRLSIKQKKSNKNIN